MDRRQFFKALAAMPLLAVSAKAQIGERTAMLLQTNVAGFRHYKGQRLWDGLCTNDPLVLVREPANPYDGRAVAVYWRKNKLGHIPRMDNAVIANLMDQDLVLDAFIEEKRQSRNPWERLWVRVEMVCLRPSSERILYDLF